MSTVTIGGHVLESEENMNESTCSSAFQTKLRQAIVGCEVIKHADKSMIGMVDASVTFRKQTLWMEYKFIGPTTKGVLGSTFLSRGEWSPSQVANASSTQADTARRLAEAGHCIYLFWVLDHTALRKRIGSVVLWHPISGYVYRAVSTDEMVGVVCNILTNTKLLELVETGCSQT
jgi:hypothetical protein